MNRKSVLPLLGLAVVMIFAAPKRASAEVFVGINIGPVVPRHGYVVAMPRPYGYGYHPRAYGYYPPRVWPSPVVALNRAVAIGFADGPAAGLDALDALADEPQLAGYGYLAAARADFLRRLERIGEARRAYREALALTSNLTERQFLEERLAGLPGG